MKKRAVRWSLICFLTYLSAYLCRVNFSAALTSLSLARGLDYELLGTAGAAFFAVYAVGQLFNGFLGDHLHPVRFIIIALIGTAACNIAVAFAKSYFLILIFWAANGYFQSVFWCILIRLLSMVTDEEAFGSASVLMSCANPTGYLISWCVLAPVFGNMNVALFFLIPAVTALPMMLLWANKSPLLPTGHTLPLSANSLSADLRRIFALLKRERLLLLPAVLICLGLVKEGITFWVPTIIRSFSKGASYTTAALALLPLASFAGTLAAKRLLKVLSHRPYTVVRMSFIIMIPVCALCLIPLGAFVLLPLCLVSALACCANTVLLSFIPMHYLSEDAVSSLVGLFDFCSYMGAALSTYVLGSLMEGRGVEAMALVWVAAAATASILLIVKYLKSERSSVKS